MDINILAVIVAALASLIIGSIWYSPLLFGNIWMKLAKIQMPKSKEKQQKMMLTSMGLGLINSLILAYVLAHFIAFTGAQSASGGAEVAFWAWLGFVLTTQFGYVIWEGKPSKLFLISGGNMLVTLLVMGVILGVWPA